MQFGFNRKIYIMYQHKIILLHCSHPITYKEVLIKDSTSEKMANMNSFSFKFSNA